MFNNEQSRVNYYNNSMSHGNSMAKKLTWDPVTKRIVPSGCHELKPGSMMITPQDMTHSGE